MFPSRPQSTAVVLSKCLTYITPTVHSSGHFPYAPGLETTRSSVVKIAQSLHRGAHSWTFSDLTKWHPSLIFPLSESFVKQVQRAYLLPVGNWFTTSPANNCPSRHLNLVPITPVFLVASNREWKEDSGFSERAVCGPRLSEPLIFIRLEISFRRIHCRLASVHSVLVAMVDYTNKYAHLGAASLDWILKPKLLTEVTSEFSMDNKRNS